MSEALSGIWLAVFVLEKYLPHINNIYKDKQTVGRISAKVPLTPPSSLSSLLHFLLFSPSHFLLSPLLLLFFLI